MFFPILKKLPLDKTPNALFLGVPGSGKSFTAKREIKNTILIAKNDDVLICDPESDYTPIVHALNGQVRCGNLKKCWRRKTLMNKQSISNQTTKQNLLPYTVVTLM